MKKVLVTGGAGFIGSHVCERFLEGGWRVTILDDFSTGSRANVPAGVPVIEASVNSAAAAEWIRSAETDAIVHLAAQADVRKSVADPLADADTNLRGTLNLLEAARTQASRPRFVFASSGGAIYGGFDSPPYAETNAKDPESPYGVSKLAAEYYLAVFARIHRLETVTLRFANVYGPRQDPYGEAGVVSIFCRRLLRGEPLTIFGSGEQTRDYVYVGDVVRAVWLGATCALKPAGRLDSRAFNIGTEKATSVLELAALLQHVAKQSGNVTHAAERRGEQMRSAVAIAKAAGELGWRPEVDLERGLGLTYEWFAAHENRELEVGGAPSSPARAGVPR